LVPTTMTHQVTQTENGVRVVEKGSSPAAALLVQVGVASWHTLCTPGCSVVTEFREVMQGIHNQSVTQGTFVRVTGSSQKHESICPSGLLLHFDSKPRLGCT
jgi:hypothetical protein